MNYQDLRKEEMSWSEKVKVSNSSKATKYAGFEEKILKELNLNCQLTPGFHFMPFFVLLTLRTFNK